MEILDPRADFLLGTAGNVTSQFGEDGVLEALFARIGTRNTFAFECGAADGLFYSNTKHLRDQGWSALLIEADDTQFDKLATHATENVHCVRQKVVGDDLDRLLARHKAPLDLDLGVIDIDGQDFWLWKHLELYRPRVMMVEYSGHKDCPVPAEGATYGQAGFKHIVELGITKKYTPLARTNVNVLLCESEVWGAVENVV